MTSRWILASLSVLVAMVLGTMVQHAWLDPGNLEPTVERPTTVAPTPAAPTAEVVLKAVVEAFDGTGELYDEHEGRWRQVAMGEEVPDDAVLRTQRGHIQLRIGETIRVEMSPYSQFRLNELRKNLSTVRLEQGLVTADVTPSQETELVLEVLGSEVEARTKDGNFSALRGKDGQVTIAGRRGTVGLRSAGKSVVVRSGEQSSVVNGEEPSIPTAIPGDLLVKLTRGHAKKQRHRVSRVEGETSPGAIVTVNGVETTAVDGHFAVNVPLTEGTNTLTITSRDVLGREKKHVVTGIEVDTSPPPTKGRVKW